MKQHMCAVLIGLMLLMAGCAGGYYAPYTYGPMNSYRYVPPVYWNYGYIHSFPRHEFWEHHNYFSQGGHGWGGHGWGGHHEHS